MTRRNRVEPNVIHEDMPVPLFFIVGVGRSGTTLLMSMLNSHPQVATPPETHFVRRYVARNPRVTCEKAAEILCNDKEFARVDIDPAQVVQQKSSAYNICDWKNTYQQMLNTYLKNSGKKYIGDKDPKLIEHIPILYKHFSTSKIIHIVRDPRDVFLSRQKAGWSKGRHWISHAIVYKVQFGMGHRLGRRLFQENYTEVQYEELITKPEATLQNICRFLGLGYNPQMLSFAERANEIVANDEKEWKKNVTGPLLPNNFNKWQQTLDRSRLICIESMCKEVFRLGLYKKACSLLSWSESVKAIAYELVAFMIDWVYRFRLWVMRIRCLLRAYSQRRQR